MAQLPSVDHEDLLRQEHARLYAHIAKGRVMAIPAIAALAVTVVLVEPTGWRTPLLATLATLVSAFFVVELIRYRRIGLTPHALARNMCVAVVAQMVVTAGTGGLASPFVYAVFPLALICGAFLAPWLAAVLELFQVSALWALALVAVRELVPDMNLVLLGGGAGPPVPAAYIYSHATTISLITVITGQLGRTLERVFRTALRRLMAAQQESLETHNDRVRELTALSAEIAHELKNPLASVKGLSALLTQNIPDGKGVERLNVLRGEVDRMQSVLEGFLSFSRPLLPLNLVSCDVAGIAAEVAALHEGLAQPRGLRIAAGGESARVRCDPRKVKQVLINLVQNAIEASPASATITMDTRLVDQVAIVRVNDRGNGVGSALGDVFEPGVTSKASGSGIGLTIARALARQHGGDLELRPREGGGTVAELRLPVNPRPPSGTESP